MTRLRGFAATVVPAVLATSGAAGAVPTAAAADASLSGYTRVISQDFAAPPGGQSLGAVACPKNYVVVGGGAGISGASPLQSINSSTPIGDGSGWRVYVNNESTTDQADFRVYATCVLPPAGYTVVTGKRVDDTAGATTVASVACPGGTVAFGGGGYATSTAPAVDLTTSTFSARGWRAIIDNDSTGGDTAQAYAVCGERPAGYATRTGAPQTVAPGSQSTDASVRCPTGTFTLGGGSTTPRTDEVSLNTTLPVGNADWVVYLNDEDDHPTTLRVTVVCATATS